MLEKIPVCISSVYQKESEFKYLRHIAKEIIEKHPFLIAVRNPEDVKTQIQFDHYIGDSLALVLILGNAPSEAVAKEVRLALEKGIPIIPLVKTTIEDNRIQAPVAAKNLLDHADWNFEDTKIYFNAADDFKAILDQIINYSLVKRLMTAANIYQNRVDIYERVTYSLERCRHLCVLAQKTPTILLGPKLGDPRDRRLYEATLNLLRRLKDGKLRQLLITFSYSETREAMRDHAKYPHVEETKKEILPLLTSIGEQIIMRATDDLLFPFMITDYNFIYKLNLGTVHRYMILPLIIVPTDQIKELLGVCETMGRYISINELQELYQ
jgi:hypothetical protein